MLVLLSSSGQNLIACLENGSDLISSFCELMMFFWGRGHAGTVIYVTHIDALASIFVSVLSIVAVILKLPISIGVLSLNCIIEDS